MDKTVSLPLIKERFTLAFMKYLDFCLELIVNGVPRNGSGWAWVAGLGGGLKNPGALGLKGRIWNKYLNN